MGSPASCSVSDRYDRQALTHKFAHSLVPIGFAYVLAHYFSLLIWQSQAMLYLASDPLGNGANLFGTANDQIDYHVISYAAIWYVQVAALLGGHVGGSRSHTIARWCSTGTSKRPSARSTGCSP